MRRLLLRAAAVLVLLVVVGLAGALMLLRRSLPLADGDAAVAGISGPIDIIRDADAIPHIFASTKTDALFGLGYVHAQDRLWQMEFQRRIGHGRLSEIFGAVTIPQDRFLRTVGFGRAARAAWASMPKPARQQIDAYVAGVNAFLAAHRGTKLPPEFSILRFEPEPWSGPDVIVWVKMMAWDLSANYSFELLRSDLVRAVGADRMAQLMPLYAHDGLSITGPALSTGEAGGSGGSGGSDQARQSSPTYLAYLAYAREARAQSAALASALRQGNAMIGEFLLGASESRGSNNWVVDGTLTASGKPMLANDPHLGTRLPSTWYLAHVSGGDLDMIGATLPGAPAVALGRNRFIAWGATNVAADVEDLYLERIDDAAGTADFNGAREPLTIVPETIVVKGVEPLRLDVRITRHGPIVSDAINANNAAAPRGPKPEPLEPLALRWTAFDADDSTIAAFLKLNEARNWDQFTAALREFVVPSQNFVYADVDGHIGYYAPGRIPMRAGGDGSRPAEGWTGTAEWTGWVPFDELPHLYDPPDHFIVTANHRPAPADYPHTLGFEWPEPYRAQRVVDMLRDGIGRRALFTPDDFARMQADTLSLHAKALLPRLLAHVRPESAPDRQAVDMLRQWNFDAAAGSAATAIFQAWFHELANAFAGDELGPLVVNSYKSRFSFITRFVVSTLTSDGTAKAVPYDGAAKAVPYDGGAKAVPYDAHAWCDDVKTDKRETCEDAVTTALHRGVVDLTRRLGGDMTRWRWDAVHPAVFPHQGLDAVAALRPLLSRSVPNGGDWSTVNVGPVAADTPFEQRSVAGYRQVIDLSPANESRFLNDVGQSGHPLSKHYDDFLADWQAVKHRRMRMNRIDIEKDSLGTLRLVPAR